MNLVAKNLLVAMMPVVLIGCLSAGKRSGGGADTDSIADTAVIAAKPAMEVVLPDTAYASAQRVKYSIEVIDTANSGILESTADIYASAPGQFTFRGGERRDAAFGGRLDSVPSRFEVDWRFDTEEDYTATSVGTWGGGTGWTGQPLYVEWPDSCMRRFRSAGLVDGDFSGREIMVGSLAAKVYFIDFMTGKPSRPAIDVTNPIKGTISLDPTLNGNLYVGQGVPAHGKMGALVIDLNKGLMTHFFGPDPKAQRGWGAYDSSAIRVGQFLFRPGENGGVYKFLVEPGGLKLHSVLRYTVGGYAPGIEASMSVYANYGYVADNAGNVLCINLNTLNPVWYYKLPDDVDATPVICEEADRNIYVYTGCEVEHEGVAEARFVKLDALTGREVWVNHTPARRAELGEKHFDGGYYATALPGVGDCIDLIFTNVVRNNDDKMNGSFVAYDRATGHTRYSVKLRYYAWSSPVGFIGLDGEMYV
ncbi:MAG: dehydrogenase, partial [Paramuribaculum sp.]|nr:dehydrogenase [Paramuribaculum sp.]